MHVEIQEGKVVTAEPQGIMAYVAVPFAKWLDRLPHA
jgi:hypothetical protein